MRRLLLLSLMLLLTLNTVCESKLPEDQLSKKLHAIVEQIRSVRYWPTKYENVHQKDGNLYFQARPKLKSDPAEVERASSNLLQSSEEIHQLVDVVPNEWKDDASYAEVIACLFSYKFATEAGSSDRERYYFALRSAIHSFSGSKIGNSQIEDLTVQILGKARIDTDQLLRSYFASSDRSVDKVYAITVILSAPVLWADHRHNELKALLKEIAGRYPEEPIGEQTVSMLRLLEEQTRTKN